MPEVRCSVCAAVLLSKVSPGIPHSWPDDPTAALCPGHAEAKFKKDKLKKESK